MVRKIGQQDGEQVVPDAPHDIARPKRPAQPVDQTAHQVIGGDSAMGEADRVQAVEADRQQGRDPVVGGGPLQRRRDPLAEQGQVRQARDLIERGQIVDTLPRPAGFGHVLEQADDVFGPAERIAHQRRRGARPKLGAVAPLEPPLRLERRPAPAQQFQKAAGNLGNLVLMDELLERLADHLFPAIAQHVFQRAVDVDDPAIHGRIADADAGMLEDRPEPLLTFTERLLGLDPLGDVDARPEQPRHAGAGSAADDRHQPGFPVAAAGREVQHLLERRRQPALHAGPVMGKHAGRIVRRKHLLGTFADHLFKRQAGQFLVPAVQHGIAELPFRRHIDDEDGGQQIVDDVADLAVGRPGILRHQDVGGLGAADRLDIQSNRTVSQIQDDDRSLGPGKGLPQHDAIDGLRQPGSILGEVAADHFPGAGTQQPSETVVHRDDVRGSRRQRLSLAGSPDRSLPMPYAEARGARPDQPSSHHTFLDLIPLVRPMPLVLMHK